MKRNILLIFGLIASTFLYAQDMMLLRNGEEIRCKVEMISSGIVSYQSNGARAQLPTSQLYMIKYEKRGNCFFNSEGESNYNTESSLSKLSKKDIAIYLCDGFEVIASEISVTSDSVSYRPAKANVRRGFSSLIQGKKGGEWITEPKGKIFLIRYFDGTREVINDLKRIEEQARIDALPKVKHPFIPINKDDNYPCPAEIEMKNGTKLSVIIYDLDREFVHYRKKEWQDGPIYRMQRSKIQGIVTK